MNNAPIPALENLDTTGIDGNQAIIELAMHDGRCLHPAVVARLEAAGYDVPEVIRPKVEETRP